MTIEVKLPDLGDGIESGDVLEIFVAVGDTIEKGQDIVEMETDKATVTVPASVGGKVTKILISRNFARPQSSLRHNASQLHISTGIKSFKVPKHT